VAPLKPTFMIFPSHAQPGFHAYKSVAPLKPLSANVMAMG